MCSVNTMNVYNTNLRSSVNSLKRGEERKIGGEGMSVLDTIKANNSNDISMERESRSIHPRHLIRIQSVLNLDRVCPYLI